MTEKDPTTEELAEAEALRRALEGDGSPDGIPDDALSVAAFLRHGGEGGALSDERSRAVLETVLAEVRHRTLRQEAVAAPADASGRLGPRRPLRHIKDMPRVSGTRSDAESTPGAGDPFLPERPGTRERRWLRWLVPALGVAATATVVALTVPGEPAGASLPAPGVALLRAQAAAIGGRNGGFRPKMAEYRASVYDAVAERYGAAR